MVMGLDVHSSGAEHLLRMCEVPDSSPRTPERRDEMKWAVLLSQGLECVAFESDIFLSTWKHFNSFASAYPALIL